MGSELRRPEPKSWCSCTAVVTVLWRHKRRAAGVCWWDSLQRPPKNKMESNEEGTQCERLPCTNMCTHVHATVHIHRENLYAYYSWADSLYKDAGCTRKGRRLGSHAGLGTIQALLFVVWEVRIWNQVHLLTSRTQLFVCKMVPSCQTQWDNVRGHFRVPHIMNFLLRYVVKENY